MEESEKALRLCGQPVRVRLSVASRGGIEER